jgi:hypothetical protein
MTHEEPPAILQIHRDTLKPGAAAAFKAIEEEAAQACRRLECPHPHVAIEAITGPWTGEVWWLNGFASEAERQRVYAAYASNAPLMAALANVGQRRPDVIASDVDVFANRRADLSRTTWQVAGARFFVVVVTDRHSMLDGAVFETAEGVRYIFTATFTREEADAIASAAGPLSGVFAVRPNWGLPAQHWIDGDPEFWNGP